MRNVLVLVFATTFATAGFIAAQSTQLDVAWELPLDELSLEDMAVDLSVLSYDFEVTAQGSSQMRLTLSDHSRYPTMHVRWFGASPSQFTETPFGSPDYLARREEACARAMNAPCTLEVIDTDNALIILSRAVRDSDGGITLNQERMIISSNDPDDDRIVILYVEIELPADGDEAEGMANLMAMVAQVEAYLGL